MDHLLLWCQRQSSTVVARVHPGHAYTFVFACADMFLQQISASAENGEFFVAHFGKGGNYKLSQAKVAEVATQNDYQVNDLRPWLTNERRDLWGRTIKEPENGTTGEPSRK